MRPSAPLPPEALYTACDPASVDFDSTETLPDLDTSLIHVRAIEAMHMSLDIRHEGYNLFVLGETGSGRHAITRQLLEAESRSGEAPADWCYVYNFADADRPGLLRLPCGRGARLRDDMQHFVTELIPAISAVFQDEFSQLPEDRQHELEAHIKTLRERMHKLTNEFPRRRRDLQNLIRQAGSEALRITVIHLIDDLKPNYADLPDVSAYIDAVLQDIIESGETLRVGVQGDRDPGYGSTSKMIAETPTTAPPRLSTKTTRRCRTSSDASSTWCTWAHCSATSRSSVPARCTGPTVAS